MKEGLNTTFGGNEEISISYSQPEKKISESEENKQLKIEINDLKIELEKLKKILSVVAHDIKNPIGGIESFSEVLIEDIKNDAITKEELIGNLSLIKKACNSALLLLEDLLLFSKLQQDRVNVEILSSNLVAQIERAIEPLSLTLEKKKITLVKEIPENTEILTDPNLVQRVIANIYSNAIKFTKEEGLISISCQNKNGFVEIHIKDDGVGLSQEQIDKIQNQDIITSEKGTSGETGTGFGLSICKEMLKKIGGTLDIQSGGKDKGSTFIISLPEGEDIK